MPPNMPDPDREKKRQQAAQVYAGMADGELRDLAVESWSLTEIGKEALKFELARRGLAIELINAPRDHAETSYLVTIRRFRDLPDALLAEGVLESSGIVCFLADDITIRMNWLRSNALSGIKLRVGSDDASDATQLLALGIPERFEVAGVGEYQQPRCPNCQSMDISFEDFNKRVAYSGIFFLGVPLLIRRRRWVCNSCGSVWAESDDEPGARHSAPILLLVVCLLKLCVTALQFFALLK